MSVTLHETEAATRERARRYLAAIPPAISGMGGEAATWQAARVLILGFRLSQAEALPLLEEWNARCSPPWDPRDLLAKLRRASQYSSARDGWLRDAPPPRSQTRSRPSAALSAPLSPEARRRLWPELRRPTARDRETVAARRHVSPDATCLLSNHRHLWRCRWRGEECYALHTGTFAQVRRMDGQPFTLPGRDPLKALNLPGSEGRFLHPGGPPRPGIPILLTEGPAGLLESTEALLRADRQRDGQWHAVSLMAATSAGSRFTDEELAAFNGCRVRIVPDNDPAGLSAAATWTTSLRAAGCTVDCVRLATGFKDLGDCLKEMPGDNPFWAALFDF